MMDSTKCVEEPESEEVCSAGNLFKVKDTPWDGTHHWCISIINCTKPLHGAWWGVLVFTTPTAQ